MSTAVILAGGQGKRLRPLTNTTPKPLISIAGRPIVEWQIRWLKGHGFKHFVLLTGYLAEKFPEVLGDGSWLGVSIEYSVEKEPLGTAGALRNARHLLEDLDDFLVINGDIITNLAPSPLRHMLTGGTVAVMALVPLPSPYGVVEVDRHGRVIGFREKPILYDYWINAGVYLMTPRVFDYLPTKGDLEKAVFPRLATEGKLRAAKYGSRLHPHVLWLSVDTHKDLEAAARILNLLF